MTNIYYKFGSKPSPIASGDLKVLYDILILIETIGWCLIKFKLIFNSWNFQRFRIKTWLKLSWVAIMVPLLELKKKLRVWLHGRHVKFARTGKKPFAHQRLRVWNAYPFKLSERVYILFHLLIWIYHHVLCL